MPREARKYVFDVQFNRIEELLPWNVPPRTRRTARSLSKPPKPRSPWPHIEELIKSDGNITIGRVASLRCAAVAADEHNMLAALVRRKGETFIELVQRLDEAVQLALEEEQFTDEINS